MPKELNEEELTEIEIDSLRNSLEFENEVLIDTIKLLKRIYDIQYISDEGIVDSGGTTILIDKEDRKFLKAVLPLIE